MIVLDPLLESIQQIAQNPKLSYIDRIAAVADTLDGAPLRPGAGCGRAGAAAEPQQPAPQLPQSVQPDPDPDQQQWTE